MANVVSAYSLSHSERKRAHTHTVGEHNAESVAGRGMWGHRQHSSVLLFLGWGVGLRKQSAASLMFATVPPLLGSKLAS